MAAQGRILAIDDEKNIRHLIESEFTLEGFDVTTAASGEEGLQRFDQDKFDMVFLDLRLPKMDGIEILKIFKKLIPAMPVIMLTGHGSEQAAREGVASGAFDYLTKPSDLEDLVAKIMQAVEGET